MTKSQSKSPKADELTEPTLVVEFGATGQKVRPITKTSTLIGRNKSCDVALDSKDIAPFHCILSRANGKVWARDCQSQSGTLINERPIRETELQDGDLLQLGPFAFRVHIPAIWRLLSASASSDGSPTAEITQIIEKQNADRQTWQADLERAQQEKTAVEVEVRRLQVHLERLTAEQAQQAEHAAASQQLTQLTESHADLHRLLDETSKQRDEYARQVEAFQKMRSDLEAQIAMFGANQNELVRVQGLLKQERESWQSERNELTKQVDAAKTSAKPAKSDPSLGSLQKQLADLRKQFDDSQAKLLDVQSKWQHDRQALEEERQLAKTQAEALQASNGKASYKLQIKAIEEKLVSVEQEREDLKVKLDEQRTIFEHHLQQSKSAGPAVSNEANAELQRQHDETRAAWQQRETEFSDERRRLETSINTLELQQQKTYAQIANLESEAGRVAELQQTIQQFEQERSVLTSQLATSQIQVEQAVVLQREVERLQEEVQTLADKLANQAPALPQEVMQYEAELNAFRHQLEETQQSLATQEEEFNSKLKQSEIEISRERAELARQKVELEKVKNEFNIELERFERSHHMNEKLAGVDKLKGEVKSAIAAKMAAAPTPNEKLSSKLQGFLKRMNK